MQGNYTPFHLAALYENSMAVHMLLADPRVDRAARTIVRGGGCLQRHGYFALAVVSYHFSFASCVGWAHSPWRRQLAGAD